MRISDWSSDVCSSDLHERQVLAQPAEEQAAEDDLLDEGHQHADQQQHGDEAGPGEALRRQGLELRVGDRAAEQRLEGEVDQRGQRHAEERSEEHTSELQSLMRSSYAVLCLQKKK